MSNRSMIFKFIKPLPLLDHSTLHVHRSKLHRLDPSLNLCRVLHVDTQKTCQVQCGLLHPHANPKPRRMRMIILGPPGSGKGTHCSKLISTFDPALIGTGDLLRWNVNHQTELGKLAEDYISRGDLLPDDVILELVKPELRKLMDRDWILDGIPRTRAQAVQLDKFLKEELNDELNLVVSLHVPDDVILHRISGRWIHGPSGRVYNTTYNPPKVEGQDDLTGEALIKRKDDTVEVFGNRLSLFHDENEPMLDYYDHHLISDTEPRKIKKLVNLFGQSSDAIWPQIVSHVQERFPHLKDVTASN